MVVKLIFFPKVSEPDCGYNHLNERGGPHHFWHKVLLILPLRKILTWEDFRADVLRAGPGLLPHVRQYFPKIGAKLTRRVAWRARRVHFRAKTRFRSVACFVFVTFICCLTPNIAGKAHWKCKTKAHNSWMSPQAWRSQMVTRRISKNFFEKQVI